LLITKDQKSTAYPPQNSPRHESLPTTEAETQPDPEIKSDIDDTTKDSISVDFQTMLKGWPQLIEAVSEQKMSVGTYLKDSRPLKLENGVLTLGFSKRALFYKEAVEQRHNQKIITDRFKDIFNAMIKLRFELIDDFPDDQPVEDINDEFLNSALNIFKGRLFK